ncbi:hypothetical protein J3R30DRAFT_3698880 [Lentinula aciculospora]|uniref:peptidylprolyl isomerase n=1 Tax=Lentinula aciculospora TaxID=153920 RepID=A0A9W9AIZ7_9AGAR|nr:hypothetical protein J3R30DRAFT_3698880 [Lentinula aciculospora]
MQILNWCLCIFAAAVATVYAEDPATYEPPTELNIQTTFAPEACTVKAKAGDSIKVHYTGKLHATGKKFDSSHDRNSPLPLKLGVGQVIKGWDDGLLDMCLGEKRTLIIPSHNAYGSRGFGELIPPNSALVFETELTELNGQSYVPPSRDEL